MAVESSGFIFFFFMYVCMYTCRGKKAWSRVSEVGHLEELCRGYELTGSGLEMQSGFRVQSRGNRKRNQWVGK